MDLLLSSAYLAPVHYYSVLYAFGKARIEQYDHYLKQTYRNRCVIATADGPLALSVPVTLLPAAKTPMRDVRISDHGNWRHLHWNALTSAYENSPFFEYYADDFRPFYERPYTYLIDFNEAIHEKVCELIGLDVRTERTTAFADVQAETADFRDRIHPKRSWDDDPFFIPRPYYQVFSRRNGFLPNLSIADLLFNMGPESILVLRDSLRPGTEKNSRP